MTSTFLSGKAIINEFCTKDKYFCDKVTVRDVSIDMKVYCVIKNGIEITPPVIMAPQEMLIVVFDGAVNMPCDCFAITYPKTSLTQKGVHVLNTGIVDPGFEGYLSTIIINYSRKPIELRKEDICFRLMLYKNETSYLEKDVAPASISQAEYIKSRISDSKNYPETFLDIKKQKESIMNDTKVHIEENIAKAVNSATNKVALFLTGIALLLTLIIGSFAFFLQMQSQDHADSNSNIAESTSSDISELKDEIQQLKQQLSELIEQENQDIQ